MLEFSICKEDFQWDLGDKEINISEFGEIPQFIKQKSQLDWFKSQSAVWREKIRPEFAEIWTIRGMGFVFNSMSGEDLLEYEE